MLAIGMGVDINDRFALVCVCFTGSAAFQFHAAAFVHGFSVFDSTCDDHPFIVICAVVRFTCSRVFVVFSCCESVSVSTSSFT